MTLLLGFISIQIICCNTKAVSISFIALKQEDIAKAFSKCFCGDHR